MTSWRIKIEILIESHEQIGDSANFQNGRLTFKMGNI